MHNAATPPALGGRPTENLRITSVSRALLTGLRARAAWVGRFAPLLSIDGMIVAASATLPAESRASRQGRSAARSFPRFRVPPGFFRARRSGSRPDLDLRLACLGLLSRAVAEAEEPVRHLGAVLRYGRRDAVCRRGQSSSGASECAAGVGSRARPRHVGAQRGDRTLHLAPLANPGPPRRGAVGRRAPPALIPPTDLYLTIRGGVVGPVSEMTPVSSGLEPQGHAVGTGTR